MRCTLARYCPASGARDHRSVLPEPNEWLWREVFWTGANHAVLDMDRPTYFYYSCYMVNALNAFYDWFRPVFEIDRVILRKIFDDCGVEKLPQSGFAAK